MIVEDLKSASTAALIDALKARGIVLWRDGKHIRYRARSGLVTAELRGHIKERKPEILRYLEAPDCLHQAGNIHLLQSSDSLKSVFCVHAIDGGIGSYVQLAKELAPVAQSYGISSIDLSARRYPQDSVIGMARHYVDQVERLQPCGPYFLVGWSSGGWIAFEMACELSRREHGHCGLTILDMYVLPRQAPLVRPPSSLAVELTPEQERSSCLWWRFLGLYTATDVLEDPFPADFWLMSDLEKSAFVLAHAGDRSMFPYAQTPLPGRRVEDIMYMYRSTHAQREALLRYKPSFLSGSIDLFVSCPEREDADEIDRRIQVAESFWRSRCSGSLHTEPISGGHQAPLQQPSVRRVAQRLVRSLERADPPHAAANARKG